MAVVTETLPNAMFKVKLENNHEALTREGCARTSSEFGDHVGVELSPYDLNRGRELFLATNSF